MRILCLTIVSLLTLSAVALAQGSASMPVAEVGFQYAYNSLTTSESGESNQSGGSVYGQYFFKQNTPRWHGRSMLSIIANFSGSASNSGSLYTYMFGPRFNIEWRKSHLVVHGEYKIGGAHVRVNGENSAGSEVSVARNSFAWGGAASGLDLVLARYYVVTLLQADFLGAEVPNVATGASHWQPDMRISAGVGFRLGQR
jgi:hypothetical protein